MTSHIKIDANRTNSLKSSGPRTAAGKQRSRNNGWKHGLAAANCRQADSVELENLAKIYGGGYDSPQILAQARIVAQNDLVLRAVRKQKRNVLEQLSDPCVFPLTKTDKGLALAKKRFRDGKKAEKELDALLPKVIEKHRNELGLTIEDMRNPYFHKIVLGLIEERLDGEEEAGGDSGLTYEEREITSRDPYQIWELAGRELKRLDRYEVRAWAQHKRALQILIEMLNGCEITICA
jgi:hypothetical protein